MIVSFLMYIIKKFIHLDILVTLKLHLLQAIKGNSHFSIVYVCLIHHFACLHQVPITDLGTGACQKRATSGKAQRALVAFSVFWYVIQELRCAESPSSSSPV